MPDYSRRRFLRYGLGAGAAIGFPVTGGRVMKAGRVADAGQDGVAGHTLRPFVESLPVPGAGIVVASPRAPGRYAFTLRQIRRQLHPQLPPTRLWAYDDGSGLRGQAGSFGMAIVARTGTPLRVSYTHHLPVVYPSWIPVDTRLTESGKKVRFLTHLHGGFVSGASDGNPELQPGGFGPGQTQTVLYPNEGPQQSARLMWFHDHVDGVTRLNVFAGLAAAYIVRDSHDTGAEPNPAGLPGGSYEIPLVIQDRQFNRDGTFRYPVSDIAGVTWIGEYFGDVMLVNGKVWPYLEVEPRLYRFRVLNGCNARIMSLDFGQAPVWQIAAEGQMWDRPVRMGQLVLAPAERADIIVDFSGLAASTLTLVNHVPAAPVSTPAPPLPAVMQFRVGRKVTRPGPRHIPARLPGRAARLPAPSVTRFITLNEVAPQTPRWFLNLNAVHFGETFQKPRAGAVEDWVYVNLTADTHPMHLHLVTSRWSAGPRSTPVPTQRPTAARRGFRAGSTPPRSPPDRWSPRQPRRAGLQGHGQGQSGLLQHHPGQVRPAPRSDSPADLRSPLPHPRARGQRHDAALHRRPVTGWTRTVDANGVTELVTSSVTPPAAARLHARPDRRSATLNSRRRVLGEDHPKL